MKKLLIALTIFASAAGCSIYRIDVTQGNILTQEMVDRLEPGMTRRQVRAIMGTPVLRDPFHADRWDYVYWFQPGGGEPEQRRVALFFENDRLVRIEGDLRPRPEGETEPEPAPTEHKVEGLAKEKEKGKGWLRRLWDRIRSGGGD